MAARTPRKQEHEEGDQETVSFADIIHNSSANDDLVDDFRGVHRHLDKVSAQVESLRAEVQGPRHTAEDNPEHAKVMRRRSLDDMQFALKRLASGESRPAGDDSPQVMQDAINEVIALRQIISDLMQASSNVYQHGLVAIRDMTSR